MARLADTTLLAVLCCSAYGVGAAGMARAEQPQTVAGSVAEAPSTSASPKTEDDEVVVTVLKRAQNIQKVPAAVTALSGADLVKSGFTALTDVQIAVPGARFQQEGNSTQVFLRGVGASLDFANFEPAVAFNFNSAYVPREGASAALFDVDKLEVLPGPQGTLYGRSAIGGIINVSSVRPRFEHSSSAILEVGNYDQVHLTAIDNIPLTDKLAFRAAFDYSYNSGYMSDGSYSENDPAGRLSLLYKPNDKLSVYVWGMVATKNGSNANLVNRGQNAAGFPQEGAYLHADPYVTSLTGNLAGYALFGQPRPDKQEYHSYMAGAQIDYTIAPGITLTYLPSYVDVRSDTSGYYIGVIPTVNNDSYRIINQELRISGSVGRITYIAGVYGYHQQNEGAGILFYQTPNQFYNSDVLRNIAEGVAEYGQLTYRLTPTFRLTLGGRYSIDGREGKGISPSQNTPYSFAKTFHNGDYKVGAEYDFAPRVMGYVTYQTGYQPGTYNERVPTGGTTNAVDPQTIQSVTVGIKARLGDKLQINDEFFYDLYHNFLAQAFDANALYNPIFNAKEVTIPGDQLDIIYKPSALTKLALSLSYTHARNTNFVTPGGNTYNGLSPAYSADWTIGGSVGQTINLRHGHLQANADVRYESSYYADYQHTFGLRQSPYAKVNASLTYYSENGGWSLGMWVKNLTNVATIAAAGVGGIPGPASAYLKPPRTFGARLTIEMR